MSDAEVIAKVRAAAEETLSCAVSWEPEARLLGNVRAADVAACARAALALAEQWEWHRECLSRDYSTARYALRAAGYVEAHQEAADRILAALRKAVGE